MFAAGSRAGALFTRLIWSPHWHPHEARAPVASVDGDLISGWIMRRYAGRDPQYRPMTPEEARELAWFQAIK